MASSSPRVGSALQLPDYLQVPEAAFGPALNEQGYFVGRVERNLFWVTDGTYQPAFLATHRSTHEGRNSGTAPGLEGSHGGGGVSERVTILAGAGGEPGRATAQKLAAAGLAVIGIDRNEEGLKELPEGIRYEVGDPTDPAQARSLIEESPPRSARPRCWSTQSAPDLGEALDATPEDQRLMIDVNTSTALWLIQAVAPYMRERGSGAIAHTPARPGLEPTAGMATYSVSKAALVHPTRVLDLELRPLGIRVNAVAPQITDTPKTRPYLPPHLLAHAVSPEAIADITVYLVSDAATPVSSTVVPAYGA
jgi:NAD(P)-dependent dehydrogenase (short-subunit alcohol dehydrogenase family)